MASKKEEVGVSDEEESEKSSNASSQTVTDDESSPDNMNDDDGRSPSNMKETVEGVQKESDESPQKWTDNDQVEFLRSLDTCICDGIHLCVDNVLIVFSYMEAVDGQLGTW